jgi:hypothetical protein
MRPKRNEQNNNSSQLVTLFADFGIPVLDSALPEPSLAIVSDFGNGIVW